MFSKNKHQPAQFSTGASAVVVDGKLILTMPDAMTPTVWQMDLEQAKSSALEIVEDKKRKAFVLVLRNIKGESIEVAPYEEKDVAVCALMMTSQALQGAQGRIKPQAVSSLPLQAQYFPQNMSPRAEEKSNKFGAFLAVTLIILLLLIWVMSVPREADFAAGTESTGSGVAQPGQVQGGVPMSADDFLSQQ